MPDAAPAGSGAPSLQDVTLRLRDTKPGARRAAAVALMGLFRARALKGACARAGTRCRGAPAPAAAASRGARRPAAKRFTHPQITAHLVACAGGLAGVEGVLWIPARVFMCARSDASLRHELEVGALRDGLLGAGAAPGLVAQVRARAAGLQAGRHVCGRCTA